GTVLGSIHSMRTITWILGPILASAIAYYMHPLVGFLAAGILFLVDVPVYFAVLRNKIISLGSQSKAKKNNS
ncbi:MAG: hypothetical protein Q6363_010375, partial [Candidatus Njordarchaeota archaeon]